MEYIPTIAQPSEPKPEYVFVDDVTHLPVPNRGPVILTDSKHRQFQVPHMPKSNCKKCHGRGYVAFEVKSGNIVICRKCYPMM